MQFSDVLTNFLRADEGGNTGNIIQIQDNLYKFDVFLFNGETRTGITFGSIEELQIVDDLRSVHSYGYMIFSDNNDVLESFQGVEEKSTVTPYNFRGDGRDYLEVEIMPQVNNICVGASTEAEEKEFSLKYTFSVYKVEEDVREDRGVKFKKLYFWDKDYQFLTEINSGFSTSEVTEEKKTILGSFGVPSSTTTNQKSTNTDDPKRYTGDSIKYLLNKCLNTKAQIGFKASSQWDRGSSMVEYHTNGSYKAIDDLQYLMEYHVSEESYGYVPCILKKTRYTDEYTFIPITSYLKNSTGGGGLLGFLGGILGGGSIGEDLYIGKLDTGNSGLGNMGSLINFGSTQSSNSFNAINYNLIETYSFLKPDADMIQKDVSTHLVYSYDPKGFFTCSIKGNNFSSSTKTIYDNNVKNLGGYDIIPKNELREKNLNVQHVYASGLGTSDNIPKYNFGRNKALMASVFKNSAIYFRVRGLTRRRSGTFFNVNRLNNQTTSDYDNVLLGKYFTTMVIHEFKKGMYYNHIYATKPTTTEQHNFATMK